MARTKIVSTIDYNKNGYELKVPLKLVTESATLRSQIPKLSYRIDLETPFLLHFEGADPQELARQLIAELDKLCSVTWAAWLLVGTESGMNLSQSFSEPGWEASLKIEVGYVLIGTNTEGKTQYVFYNGANGPDLAAAELRHNYKRQGLPETGHQDKWRGHNKGPDLGSNRALIPDTEENRARLKKITDAITSIGVQIAAVLSPEKIGVTLAGPGFALLGMET